MKLVEIYTRDNCSYCTLAKAELNKRWQPGVSVVELDIMVNNNRNDLTHRIPGVKTVPQIFIDGRLIGGYDDLMQYFDETTSHG